MQSRHEVEKRILESIKSNLSLMSTVLPLSGIRPSKTKDKVVYISSPITTGSRMYRYMSSHKISDVVQISSDILFEKIMTPNIRESIVFSDTLRKLGHPLIIVPGHFIADGWTQEHYLDLWTKVIRDFAHVICFNKGWEYSNGCVKELLIALESNKEIVDSSFIPIKIPNAIAMIDSATRTIEKIGVVPELLYQLRRKIELHRTKSSQYV